MIAFDTDVLTEILLGNAECAARASAIPEQEQVVPIIVIEEIVRCKLLCFSWSLKPGLSPGGVSPSLRAVTNSRTEARSSSRFSSGVPVRTHARCR